MIVNDNLLLGSCRG